MAGGLRYQSLSQMPPPMRGLMVEQVLTKYKNLEAPPEPESCCRGEECILWWECNGVAAEAECPWRKEQG